MRNPIIASVGILCMSLLPGCGSKGTAAPPRASMPLPSNDAQLAQANVGPAHNFGKLELVAEFSNPMPTGVTVAANGRIFVCIPRWVDPMPFTVAELRNGQLYAYPSAQINRYDEMNYANTLVSVQSVVVDPEQRLWLLDTGSVNMGTPRPFGPKL